jgi:hypothetical protein
MAIDYAVIEQGIKVGMAFSIPAKMEVCKSLLVTLGGTSVSDHFTDEEINYVKEALAAAAGMVVTEEGLRFKEVK